MPDGGFRSVFHAVAVSALLATGLVLAACGDSGGDTTVIQTTTDPSTDSQSQPNETGPRLGDKCFVETANTALVEVHTKKGPLTCAEAKGILRLYYDNVATQGTGSGGGLRVAGWFCITAPLGESTPLGGRCDERRGERRKFEMYDSGWARRPGNRNSRCEYPLPDGAGIFEVRATNLDCEAATSMATQYESGGCVEIGPKGGRFECRLAYGFVCGIESIGYESGLVTCRERDQAAVFKTGA